MKKYFKYTIFCFLVFGLTVNDGANNYQVNSKSYHQVSYADSKKESDSQYSKFYVYTDQFLLEKVAITSPITSLNLDEVCSRQTQIFLKQSIKCYQKIKLKITQHLFLHTIISSNIHYSNLYIA